MNDAPSHVRVPCSTSNLGAGFDCVGLALDLHLDATYSPGPGPLEVVRAGTLAELPVEPHDDLLVRCFVRRMQAAGRVARGELRVTSAIPVARGLGSSAAAVVAGLALARLAACDPTGSPGASDAGGAFAELFEEAAGIEAHPDNVAPALLGGLVAVTPRARGASGPRFAATRLPLSPRIGFAFAAPGLEVPTARARAALPADVPHAVAVRSVARVLALVRGLAEADPDALRAGFADELHVPYRLALIPRAHGAMAAAVDAGAWTATISGSGSGLIAVCPRGAEAAVADAMCVAFGGVAAGATALVLRPDVVGARMVAERGS